MGGLGGTVVLGSGNVVGNVVGIGCVWEFGYRVLCWRLS